MDMWATWAIIGIGALIWIAICGFFIFLSVTGERADRNIKDWLPGDPSDYTPKN